MNTPIKATLCAFLCFGAIISSAQTPPASRTPADNTKVNKRDQHPSALTADQQKINADDQELTRSIRRSIMADKTLSTYAHNIKIIGRNGVVTLKGPVKSEAE